MEFKDGSYDIIGVSMEVHNELGPGLREKPYENAMVIALREKGFRAEQQRAYPIYFKDHIVGDCIPDITVDSAMLIDAKSVEKNWRERNGSNVELPSDCKARSWVGDKL